jgi:hypothetical protein
MKTNNTFFAILFISSALLLISIVILNPYLLAVSEILFLLSALILFINNNLKIKTNEKRN